MIQRLSPHFGRFDKYLQVVNDLYLAGEISDLRRTDIVFKFLVRGG
jgi:hypothetical protein